MNPISSLVFGCVVLVLISCGGGGGGSSNAPNPPGNSINTPPTADAGPDASAKEDTSVFLRAMDSTDSDGVILSFAWSQTSGIGVSLENPDTPTAVFTAPLVNSATELTFRLTVIDDDGASSTDDITVTIVPNQAPVANAGDNRSAAASALVPLDGTGSNDPDGTIASYAWSQTDGPEVDITNAGQATATFTVPDATAANTQFTFQLTVTDDSGSMASDSITITVLTNLAPVADAGTDQFAGPSTLVTLDGSDSSDTDGSIAAYAWTQTDGPDVELTGADQPQASFTSPVVVGDTVLTFELTVTDELGTTASDSVSVTVVSGSFNLSGTIVVPQGAMVDSDVNDVNTTVISNNSFENAQSISNPVTLGGYVNTAGAGPAGSLQAEGDPWDVFAVHLLEGQVVTLLVAAADPGVDDVDLYLYDDEGELVDSSIATGEVEQIIIPSTADYYLAANAYGGVSNNFTSASNYTLIIGQEQVIQSTFRLSNDFIPGETVVKYRNNLPVSALNKGVSPIAAQLGFQRKAGAARRETLLELNLSDNQVLNKTSVTARLPGRFKSEADRNKWQTLVALKELSRDPAVEYAEPNFILKPLLVPNDEYYGLQWHYSRINLPAAWDITTGSPDVTVAVIDTGVLLSHPDLQGQLIDGYDFIRNGSAAADGDGMDANPDDAGDSDGSVPSSFHGTHVSGTIAAASNNSKGVAGVAWNVRIMPLRALGIGGGSGYDINQAIRYAAGLDNDSGQVPDEPADVINMSLGAPVFSQVTQNTINDARAAGVTIVAAAGNDGNSQLFYPASYDGVISVSAVGPQNTLTPYSNFGGAIDVAAPGGDVRRDINGDGYVDGVLSTGGDDSGTSTAFNYNFQNGTSMASPHVAGVIALMKSVNQTLTPEQIDTLLSDGQLTDDLGTAGRDNSFGHGLINAQKAVAAALNAMGTPPEETPELGVTPTSLNFANASELDLILRNNGGGSLEISAIAVSETWLAVNSGDDVDAQGLGTYRVAVDTTGLADGIYSASITVSSNNGNYVIPVILPVGDVDLSTDAGLVYVLLVDLNSGAVVDQDNVQVGNGVYQYQFDGVPAGRYQIIAGSDRDNDDYICDSGEACGAYTTLDHPQAVSVESGDLTDLGFVINLPSALPTSESLATSDSLATGAGAAGNPHPAIRKLRLLDGRSAHE